MTGWGDCLGDDAVRHRCSSLAAPSSSSGCVPEFGNLAFRRKSVFIAVVAFEIVSSALDC